MRFITDISNFKNGRDKILSVCQCDPSGVIQYEVITQRGPKEFLTFP